MHINHERDYAEVRVYSYAASQRVKQDSSSRNSKQIKAQTNTLALKTSQLVDRDNFDAPGKYLCCDYRIYIDRNMLRNLVAYRMPKRDYKLYSGNLTVAYDNISSQHNSLFFLKTVGVGCLACKRITSVRQSSSPLS
uniref:Uncharacterized protein n=1 Tax=Glossina palpalis gambiensis TaxID=67801 RepID=A0A1B0BGP4_9MUSC